MGKILRREQERYEEEQRPTAMLAITAQFSIVKFKRCLNWAIDSIFTRSGPSLWSLFAQKIDRICLYSLIQIQRWIRIEGDGNRDPPTISATSSLAFFLFRSREGKEWKNSITCRVCHRHRCVYVLIAVVCRLGGTNIGWWPCAFNTKRQPFRRLFNRLCAIYLVVVVARASHR